MCVDESRSRAELFAKVMRFFTIIVSKKYEISYVGDGLEVSMSYERIGKIHYIEGIVDTNKYNIQIYNIQ